MSETSGPARSLSVGDKCPECGHTITETTAGSTLAYCWWCNDRNEMDNMDKTPKQKLVASMDRPFKEVDKQDCRSPLKEIHPNDCDHERAFITDAYPVPGPTFVCADCGRITDYPEDLE